MLRMVHDLMMMKEFHLFHGVSEALLFGRVGRSLLKDTRSSSETSSCRETHPSGRLDVGGHVRLVSDVLLSLQLSS